jgi:hypothetical protein
MTEATNAPADPLREALAVGEQFLNKCNAAWAAGEPSHRVNDMLDAADKFRDALEALSATREEGGAIPADVSGEVVTVERAVLQPFLDAIGEDDDGGWTFDPAGPCDEDWKRLAEAATPKAQAPSDHRMSASEADPAAEGSAWQSQAHVLLNMHGTDPAEWSGEETRRVFDLISAVANAQLPQDVVRLIIAARMVAWEDPDAENLKELQEASEAFASRVPWEDEPEDEA